MKNLKDREVTQVEEGQTCIRKAWKVQLEKVRAAYTLRVWLVELYSLLEMPKYSVTHVTKFDKEGIPVAFVRRVDKESNIRHIEMRRHEYCEFIKSRDLQEELLDNFCKATPSVVDTLNDLNQLLIIQATDISLGGDRYVSGIDISLCTYTEL